MKPAPTRTHKHTFAHAGRPSQGCLVTFLLRNVFSGLLEASQSVIVELVLK